ncbi:MAG: class I SAM-dependent methyltransferase [Bryobacteraceae bacterium]
MSHTHTTLSDELAAYLRRVSLREPDVMRRLRERTASVPEARMQITPEQGQFMQLLVQILGARKTLEVGVFTGYSSLAVALALPPDGQVTACDVSEEWTSIGKPFWQEAGVSEKIDLILAPAVETLDGLIAAGQQGTYDFAFIDADKANYDRYYERALVLVRAGGLIGIDNVLWHSKVIDSSVNDADTVAIRNLNEKIHQDRRVGLSLLPIGDGLTLARKL